MPLTLLVTDNQTATLTPQATRYAADVAGRGVTVTQRTIDAGQPLSVVAGQVQQALKDTGADTLFLVGGFSPFLTSPVSPDGHDARPVPTYWPYADTPGSVYTPGAWLNTAPAIRVGVVNLDNLPVFGKPAIQLYADYFDLLHGIYATGASGYGLGAWVYNEFGMDGGFNYGPTTAQLNAWFGANGWTFGDGDPATAFAWLHDNPHLWAFLVGHGVDETATNLHNPAATLPRAVVAAVEASYVINSEKRNSYLRSLNASCACVIYNPYDAGDFAGMASRGMTAGEFVRLLAGAYRQPWFTLFGDPNMANPPILSTDARLSAIEGEVKSLQAMVSTLPKTTDAGGGNGSQVNSGPSPGTSASFVKADTKTQGKWPGVYGNAGLYIVGLGGTIPAWATFQRVSGSSWTWTAHTSDARGLQLTPGDYIAACDFEGTNGVHGASWGYDLQITDGQAHPVALYCLDWDPAGRNQTVQIVDAVTGAVLDTQTVSGFAGGKWLVYNIAGHVRIVFTNINSVNAVCSAVMFG